MWTSIAALLSGIFAKGKSVVSNHKLPTAIVIAVLILFGWVYFTIQAKDKQIAKLEIANANIKAANDSIRVTTTKNNQVEYDKYAYLATDYNQLKKVNDSLYEAIKNTKGQVITVIKTQTQFVDTGKLVVTKIIDSATKKIEGYQLSFDTTYSPGNYHHLKAVVHVDGIPDSLDLRADLKQDQIGFTAITGLKKNKNGDYEIFVQPSYPGATITKLDGAYVSKTLFQQPDKRRLVTLGIGFGYLPLTYDWRTHSVELLPAKLGLSVGINVNLTELLRKK